jgi:2-isopropylmalate synthase
MDSQGRELSAGDIWGIFEREYHLGTGAVLVDHLAINERGDGRVELQATLRQGSRARLVKGVGNGPVEAFVDGLQRAIGSPIAVLDYHEHAIGAGAQARAAAYLELRIGDTRTLFGVGIDANIVTASLKAVLSGLQRCGLTWAAETAPA